MNKFILSIAAGFLVVSSIWSMEEVTVDLKDGKITISSEQHEAFKKVIDESFEENGVVDSFKRINKKSFSLIIEYLEDITKNGAEAAKKISDELYTAKKYKVFARLVRAADFLGIDSIAKYVNDNLHMMVSKKPEFVEALLSAAGVPYNLLLDIDQKDRLGKTLLTKATLQERLKIVQNILALGGSWNEDAKRGKTGLCWASKKGLVELVRYLVDQGADINKPDNNRGTGYTPLMYAARNGHIRCLKILIDAGADLNTKSGAAGYTALMMAGMAGDVKHVACVKLLLEAGADCDVQDSDGYTALMLATKVYGNIGAEFIPVVKLLLEYGARTDIFALDGKCAHNLASLDYKNETLCNVLKKAAEEQKKLGRIGIFSWL